MFGRAPISSLPICGGVVAAILSPPLPGGQPFVTGLTPPGFVLVFPNTATAKPERRND